MFNFFRKNRTVKCPLDRDSRLWMENAFLWLTEQFKDTIQKRSILLPTLIPFEKRFDSPKDRLISFAKVVSTQFEIDFSTLKFETYKNNIQQINSSFSHSIWTEYDDSQTQKPSAGLFFDKGKNGKFDIFIEESNLNDPIALVSVLSHEFSHIKIIGEKRLPYNDERLTDLATVVFGLGIFNANVSFREYKTSASYGYSSMGYLSQSEWGYALALYAYYKEEENPNWIKYLSPNIKSDFKRGMKFIHNNTDIVFHEIY